VEANGGALVDASTAIADEYFYGGGRSRRSSLNRTRSPPSEIDMTAPLLPEGAFVIQFRAGTDVELQRVEGRVEHVISGQAMRFDSLETLLAFFARVLKDEGAS
jgi:hypothetical protein